jgi:hypothetical protein
MANAKSPAGLNPGVGVAGPLFTASDAANCIASISHWVRIPSCSLLNSLGKIQLTEKSADELACYPPQVDLKDFNAKAQIPWGVKITHIRDAMNEFVDFIGFMNQQLHGRNIRRLETMLMPANFSSIVGEFMSAAIPKHCPTISKNNFHNGHPDMVPTGMFPGNSVQHASQGIEIKGSRYLRGWQGHNAEDTWLMVFCYEAGRATDEAKNVAPHPFRFLGVFGAELLKSDWTFSGRSAESRRTITASVNNSGFAKMSANWIYRAPARTSRLA